MNLKSVLAALFAKMGNSRRTTTFGYEEVQRWEKSVLPILLKENLVISTVLANQMICRECEKACTVILQKDFFGLTAYCTENEDMENQKWWTVNEALLQQWLIDTDTIVAWLKKNLPLLLPLPPSMNKINVTPLGLLEVEGIERCNLALSIEKDIALIVNNEHSILLVDLFHVDPHNSVIQLDGRLVEQYQRVVTKLSKVEQPKRKKSRAANAKTERMYASWRKKYKEIRRKHPNKPPHSDNWVSIEISKLPIAQGRHKDTIRKHMIA